MTKEAVLQNFGLTIAEINVYTALLQMGELTASEIAKKTGTNRTFTYDRLKKLGDMGLVSSIIKENKRYFKAAEPSQILSILRDREEEFKSILPELENLRLPMKSGPEVEVYSGIKGVKTALNLMLKERNEICLHGTLKKFQEKMPTHFEIWNKRRIKSRIRMRILSSEITDLGLSESGILPEEEQTVTSNFTFGDTIVIAMWGDYPVAIMIKGKEIAENSISFFNAVWEREVKIYSGAEGIVRAFFELLERTKEFVGFGFSKKLSDIYTSKISDDWHVERIKKRIKCRLVALEEKGTRDYFMPRRTAKRDFNVRFLPKELQGPACVSMSDNTLATFVYTEKRFRVVLNKNRETVNVYKKHFEELWKKSKP